MPDAPLSAVVVVVGANPAALFATLDGIARQAVRPRDVVVVFGTSATDSSRLMCEAVEGLRVTTLRADSPLPGVMRNMGVQRSAGEFVCWLDAGDVPRPDLFELTVSGIRGDGLDFIAPLNSSGDVHESPTVVVPSITVADLRATSHRLPIGALMTRDAWNAVGGFDKALPALDEYDFWIRAVQHGLKGVILNKLLIRRPLQPDTDTARRLRSEASNEAAGLVAERHREMFAGDPAAALISRVRDRAHLDSRYTAFLERRQRLIAELDANQREIGTLENFLREHGRDGVDWGELRHPWPVSHDWGYSRGTPVDRVYIEQFVGEWADDVQGRVLEVQEADLTCRFGGERVTRSDVIDINAENAAATIVADLRDASHVPSDAFDCFILTQTLHVIDDMPAVVREAYRILKPGGVLLATLPCASRVCLEYGPDGDFWRVTEAGARRLFEQVFAADQVQTRAFGNVLSNVAFLLGLGSHEISDEEFASFDPYFPLLIGVRSVKPGQRTVPALRRIPTAGERPGVVLLYHRVAELDADVHGLAVPPRLFRQHLEFLKASRHVMALDELADAAEQGALPEGALAITFDDGYRDNLDNAAPLLVELGLPATFFLTTQALDGQLEYWWDALERALLLNESVPDALAIMVGDQHLRMGTSNVSERRVAHDRLHDLLVHATLEVRDACIAEVLEWSGTPVRSSSAPILTAHEVQQLSKLPGCSIGTHTVHHLALGSQPADVVKRELRDGRRALEALIGQSVTAVAYPYGDYTGMARVAAKAGGLRIGMTCDSRWVLSTDDLLALPRLGISSWGVAEMASRLASISGISQRS